MAAALELVLAAGLVPDGKPEDRLGLELADEDNAERLRRAYGRNLLFVIGRGWGGWSGTHFDFDAGPWIARACAAKLRELVRAEALAMGRAEIDDMTAARFKKRREEAAANRTGRQKAKPVPESIEEAKTMLRAARQHGLHEHADACGARAKINAALELLEPKLVEVREHLDADPWRLACPNGTLDLRAAVGEPPDDVPAGKRRAWMEDWDARHEAEDPDERAERLAACLSPPDREMRPTRVLGVPFDPRAECPKFDAFLQLIQPDAAVRGFVLRAVSLILYGRNSEQVVLLLRGAGGNGKSTLVQVLAYLIGGYGAAARIAMFLYQDTERPGQASPEEIPLVGARAIFASEPKASDRLGADRIKAFTGGDRRMVRALNQPPFEYVPTGVPILQFNRTPQIPDEDEGTWRRLVFLPFDVNLRELPPELRRHPEDVLAELKAEGPGILNRLIEAFATVRRIGLSPPERATQMKEELRAASDPVGQFIASCCSFDPDYERSRQAASSWVQAKTFGECFAAWCEANGFRALAPQTVRKLVQEKGYHSRTVGGRTYYLGLQVTTDLRDGSTRQDYAGGAAEPDGGRGGLGLD